jgi:hypothetical protein
MRTLEYRPKDRIPIELILWTSPDDVFLRKQLGRNRVGASDDVAPVMAVIERIVADYDSGMQRAQATLKLVYL